MARFSLKQWWRRRRLGPWRIAVVVSEADQVPVVIPQHRAVVVRSNDFEKWLVFDCPCGKEHRIMLNLDAHRYPHWTVSEEDPLSVWPSVDTRIDGRRCHYVIYNGHVEWVHQGLSPLRSWPGQLLMAGERDGR